MRLTPSTRDALLICASLVARARACVAGVFFPFVIGNLQTMYGRNNNLWVCAMISSSFALGGLV